MCIAPPPTATGHSTLGEAAALGRREFVGRDSAVSHQLTHSGWGIARLREAGLCTSASTTGGFKGRRGTEFCFTVWPSWQPWEAGIVIPPFQLSELKLKEVKPLAGSKTSGNMNKVVTSHLCWGRKPCSLLWCSAVGTHSFTHLCLLKSYVVWKQGPGLNVCSAPSRGHQVGAQVCVFSWSEQCPSQLLKDASANVKWGQFSPGYRGKNEWRQQNFSLLILFLGCKFLLILWRLICTKIQYQRVSYLSKNYRLIFISILVSFWRVPYLNPFPWRHGRVVGFS